MPTQFGSGIVATRRTEPQQPMSQVNESLSMQPGSEMPPQPLQQPARSGRGFNLFGSFRRGGQQAGAGEPNEHGLRSPC